MTHIHTEVAGAISDAELAAIAQIVERVVEVDGARPLSEQVMADLLDQVSLNPTQHVFAREDQTNRVVGYAHLDPITSPSFTGVEIAVDENPSRIEIASELIQVARDFAPTPINVWSHGGASPVAAAAAELGFVAARTLLRMRRTLADLTAAAVPEGYTIRKFDPESDKAALLDVNARAFVALPDQGSWTQDDLAARLSADWFDADGFFVVVPETPAESGSQLVGFHWTKMHRAASYLGEVYVIAVDPGIEVRGLGRALLNRGLNYLADSGAREVILFVDAINTRAVAMYEKAGFVEADRDVMYAEPEPL